MGLHGAAQFHISDLVAGGPVKIYPTLDVARVALRTPALPLTPGCLVRASLVALPSGQTEPAMVGVPPTGPQGKVYVGVIYNNGADTIVQKSISIPASNAEYHAQPKGAGASWASLYEFTTDLFKPDDLDVLANLAAWSDGITATIAVAYIGSPRVIDLVVFEEPFALAYDLAGGDWIAPMHADAQGKALPELGGPVPVTKRSASDPGGGVEILTDAAARVCQKLGPVLVFATAWNEAKQDILSTETDYRAITGTDYVDIISLEVSSFDDALPGWSASSGANARRVQESATAHVLRDADNVIPVKVWIYGAMSTADGSPTATVRFETAEYSVAEVAIPAGTSYAWHSATGHLRCGLGPQDPAVMQVRAKCSTDTGSPEFRWRYLAVTFADL
ncbi:MAG TPA: hypothetical protein VIK91_12475 [Nannocystis sp.]